MSPILMDAVTKARRSPNAPKTKAQAQRRLARYQRLADAAGDKPTGRIASAEAQRLQSVIGGGKYGRGATDGRAELERQRIAERKRTDRNNDGWIDGQKPKGAKPRKTATKPPADDLDPSSPNYRFKDTGYVAGSRKELAADMIRRSGKSGNRLRVTDIDWKSLEENPREAAAVITKSNLFGQVDWAKHRAEGMTPEAGFLIDRVYASIGKGPVNDTPQGRKDYALGLESLRDRLEKAKTADEVVAVVDGIREEMRGKMLTDADSKAIAAAVERRRDAANKIAPLRAEMDAAYKAMNRAEGDVSRFKYEASKRERRGWKADPEITASLQAAQQSADKLRADYTAIRDRVNPTIKALEDEYRSASQAIMAVEALAVARSADHPTKRAWNELGPRFAAVANFRSQKGSGAFRDHVTSAKVGRMKDWSWADQETMTATKERKESVRFQLEVADTHERIGGRAVNAASTADLKKQFNLREVQSGNWVLRDVAAAKFHTEQTAGALSDLADVIGAPDGEVSLNGRIALAFGARGTGNAGGSSARAHYEAVHRVINLTKMSGGGTLAHEWFHALDNLVGEMEAARPGKASDFATETDGLPDGELKSAFKFLNTAMMEGNVQGRRRFGYTANDVRLAVANVDRATYGLGLKIKQAASAEDAIAAVEDAFPPRSLSRRGMKARRQQWLGIAAAHFGKKPDGGDLMVTAGPRRSRFAIEAERLDATTASARTYWAQPKEMAARAFQAYVEDRLAGQGRRNDYLSAKADNRFYAPLGLAPFPEGEERERINRAFDDLFAVLRKRGTLRKALSHGPYTIKKGRQAMTPAQGKARVKITAQGRKVSYGQAGNAKDGGPRVRPGTAKGDAYCARSAGQMRDHPRAAKDPNSPLRLSRARWKCSGKNTLKKRQEDPMSPILSEAIAKARKSLPIPRRNSSSRWMDTEKTRQAIFDRAERYDRFARAPGKRPAGGKARQEIARAEAARLRGLVRDEAAWSLFGRGGADAPAGFDGAPGRAKLEQDRAKAAAAAARRKQDKNNDGYPDGLKPKGAKPRKTATDKPRSVMGETDAFAAKRPSRAKAKDTMSLGPEDISPNARRNDQHVGAKVSDAKANVMAISRLDAASLRQMAKDNPVTLNWALETKMTLAQMRRVHQALTGKKLPKTAGFTDHQRAIRAALPDMGGAGRMRVKTDPVRKAIRKALRCKTKDGIPLTRKGKAFWANRTVRKAKQGDKNLRARYGTFLRQASGGKDASRIKITRERIDRAKALMAESSKRRQDVRNWSDTRHLKAAKLLARRAVRSGLKPKLKMPDGPLGSAYVRLARGKTVRFADHAAPIGGRYDLPKHMRDRQPGLVGDSSVVPVGGFSSRLGRRHGPAALSVAIRRHPEGRGVKGPADYNYHDALKFLRTITGKVRKDAMSPILSEAIAKASRSLNAPKNKRQAQRRLERYNQLARSKGDITLSRMAHGEAHRLEQYLQAGKYGRGDTEGRAAGEAVRARRRTDRNNDGWVDGQKPAGAKPRKTATERPALNVKDVYSREGNDAVYASIKDMRFSELKALIQQEGLRANLPAPRTAADARKYIQVAAKETYGRRGDPVGALAGNARAPSDPVRQAVRDATAKEVKTKAEAAGRKTKAEAKRASEQQRAKFRMEWRDLPTPDKTGVGSAEDKFGRESERYRREVAEVERMKGERARVQERIDRAMAGRTHKPSTGYGSAPPYMSDRERQDQMLKPRMKTTDADKEVLARLRALTPKHTQMIRDYTANLDDDTRDGLLDYYGMLGKWERRRYRERTGQIKKSAALHEAVVYAHVVRINKALRALAA